MLLGVIIIFYSEYPWSIGTWIIGDGRVYKFNLLPEQQKEDSPKADWNKNLYGFD